MRSQKKYMDRATLMMIEGLQKPRGASAHRRNSISPLIARSEKLTCSQPEDNKN